MLSDLAFCNTSVVTWSLYLEQEPLVHRISPMSLPQARLQGKRESFLTDVGTQLVMPALGRQRQESLKFKASLGYKMKPCFKTKQSNNRAMAL